MLISKHYWIRCTQGSHDLAQPLAGQIAANRADRKVIKAAVPVQALIEMNLPGRGVFFAVSGVIPLLVFFHAAIPLVRRPASSRRRWRLYYV